jgi:hypothetical protein
MLCSHTLGHINADRTKAWFRDIPRYALGLLSILVDGYSGKGYFLEFERITKHPADQRSDYQTQSNRESVETIPP